MVESGLNVYVLAIPPAADGGKQDPDSFFTSKEQFDGFQSDNARLFLDALAESRSASCAGDPVARARTVKEIATLFADLLRQKKETEEKQEQKEQEEEKRRNSPEQKAKEEREEKAKEALTRAETGLVAGIIAGGIAQDQQQEERSRGFHR